MATPEPSARLAKIHAHSLGRALGLRNVKSPRTASRSHAGDQAAKRAETSAAPAPAGALDSAALAKTIGHQDEQTGPVCKITIGRPDIDPREPGAAINARMGLNTWPHLPAPMPTQWWRGDVAMLEHEVTPSPVSAQTIEDGRIWWNVTLQEKVGTTSPWRWYLEVQGRMRDGVDALDQ